MGFYQIPANLKEDVLKFEQQINAYQAGDLDPVQFKGIRVAHGIYEQRERETYMMRIRCSGGAITPIQLRTLAEISIRFKLKKLHVTTRQEIQLHFLKLENVIEIYQLLTSVGLSSRGGGGNTIRNITSPHLSGIDPAETFDVSAYAGGLTTRLIAEPDSLNLPRKMKIVFSNTDADSINFTVTCLAFVAKIKDGKRGFKVYCGGGLGTVPKVGKVLLDWVADDQVYYVARSIKSLFDKYGNRRIRTKGKIKWLVEKLGREKFIELFNTYYLELQKEQGLSLKLEDVDNSSQIFEVLPAKIFSGDEAFELWKSRYVKQQKQQGLYSIRVPLHLGDIPDGDAFSLGSFLEKYGKNTIRLSITQDIFIRNIAEVYLGNIYEQVVQLETLSEKPEMIANFVACTGAAKCSLGIALSRNVAKEVQDALEKSDIDLELLNDVNINFSGCPHSCANQYTSDIGFAGRVGKEKHDMYAAYSIYTGGNYHDSGSTIANKVSQIATKQLPEFIVELIKIYLKDKSDISFKAYVASEVGISVINDLTKEFAQLVPTLAENEAFYHDWGESKRFSLLKGRTAECSAGLYDLVDVDFKGMATAESIIKEQTLNNEQLNQQLNTIVFHSARALLITRGVEPLDNNQVYDSFEKHFIKTGIVDSLYSPLLQIAKSGDLEAFSPKKEEVLSLADYMRDLYKGMDESLRFKTESTDFSSQSEPDATTGQVKEGIDLFKDFRGVQCPMNFVKTKLALSQIEDGQLLEVYLDDGQPIDNVPRSVLTEGHIIVEQNQFSDKAWSVVIQKN